ncbi:MAG TPA: hypothetical protein VFH51_14415 [Myxococcota bacterium]|nr:hypothetical protein [Myxococcota bacterium]
MARVLNLYTKADFDRMHALICRLADCAVDAPSARIVLAGVHLAYERYSEQGERIVAITSQNAVQSTRRAWLLDTLVLPRLRAGDA